MLPSTWATDQRARAIMRAARGAAVDKVSGSLRQVHTEKELKAAIEAATTEYKDKCGLALCCPPFRKGCHRPQGVKQCMPIHGELGCAG